LCKEIKEKKKNARKMQVCIPSREKKGRKEYLLPPLARVIYSFLEALFG
jgi:hypothetical protein